MRETGRASLVSCAECGHQISPRAEACPECKWKRCECRICKRPIARDDYVGERTAVSTGHFHRDCLTRAIPRGLKCTHCNEEFEDMDVDLLARYIKSCPSCGGP